MKPCARSVNFSISIITSPAPVRPPKATGQVPCRGPCWAPRSGYMYGGPFEPQGPRSPGPGLLKTKPAANPGARLLQPVAVVALVVAVIGGFRQREHRGAADHGLHRPVAIAIDVPVDIAIGLGPLPAILLIVLLALIRV